MSSALDRARSWLFYNRVHRVLICRYCQHAIQKSAIDSHLLKHKIYRGERQSLLREVAKLDLPEPEDIPHPGHCPSPVEGLPVLHGYRCSVGECAHLTLSEKRVKSHWSQLHSSRIHMPPVTEIARPVCMQTLFKGTKLNYFEVAICPDDGHSSTAEVDNSQGLLEVAGTSHISQDEPRADLSTFVPSKTPSSSVPYDQNPHPSSSCLDLEALACLHYFITVTTHSLPYGLHYWQDQVFTLAREHVALMNGLLAIAAKQQALTANSWNASQEHSALHEKFYQSFQEMAHTALVGGTQHQSRVYQITTVAQQIDALLRCARRVTEKQTDSRISWRCSSFAEIVYDIGLCCAHKPESLDTSPSVLETFTHQPSAWEDLSHQDEPLLEVINQHLLDLPSRMAQTLGRPSSANDVVATIAAISALRECCRTSFSSNLAAGAWESMSSWLTLVPKHFHEMLNAQAVAAIITFANWAGILLRRAELKGCWPVQGLSETILSECTSYLSTNAPAAGYLIPDVLRSFQGSYRT